MAWTGQPHPTVEKEGLLSAAQVEMLLARALKKGKRDITEVGLDELLVAEDYLEERDLLEPGPRENRRNPDAHRFLGLGAEARFGLARVEK